MGDLRLHNGKVLVFYRNGLLFAFNFDPSQSFTDVVIPVPNRANYSVAMCSDDEKYGGQQLVEHMTYRVKTIDGKPSIQLYLPARTAVVLKEGKIQQPRAKKAAEEAVKPSAKKAPAKKADEPAEKKPAKKATRKKADKAE